MTFSFTPGIRRLIAWMLLACVIATLWFGILQPLLRHFGDSAERRGIALRALRRDRALLHEEPAIQAAAATVEQSARWRNFYESDKPESATLELESDLRALFKETNSPTSMIAEPAVPHGAAVRIAVRVTLSLRVDQLAKTLDRLQKHSRQLRIEGLTVQAPDIQNSQTNPVLNVQAEIAAWMLTPQTA